ETNTLSLQRAMSLFTPAVRATAQTTVFKMLFNALVKNNQISQALQVLEWWRGRCAAAPASGAAAAAAASASSSSSSSSSSPSSSPSSEAPFRPPGIHEYTHLLV